MHYLQKETRKALAQTTVWLFWVATVLFLMKTRPLYQCTTALCLQHFCLQHFVLFTFYKKIASLKKKPLKSFYHGQYTGFEVDTVTLVTTQNLRFFSRGKLRALHMAEYKKTCTSQSVHSEKDR